MSPAALKTTIFRSLIVLAGALLLDAVSFARHPMHLELNPESFAQLVGIVLIWSALFVTIEGALTAWLSWLDGVLTARHIGRTPSLRFAIALSPLAALPAFLMTRSKGARKLLDRLGPGEVLLIVGAVATLAALTVALWLAHLTWQRVTAQPRRVQLGLLAVPVLGVIALNWADSRLYVGLYAYVHGSLMILQLLGLRVIAGVLLPIRSWTPPRPMLARLWVPTALVGGMVLTIVTQRADTLERHALVFGTTLLARLQRVQARALQVKLPEPAAVSVPTARPNPPALCRHAVVVALDGVRWDHTNLSGYSRRTTPMLAELAKRGLVVQHAVSSASSTTLSVPSILLGAPPPEHRKLLAATSPSSVAAVAAAAGFDTYCYAPWKTLRPGGTPPERLGCNTAGVTRLGLDATQDIERYFESSSPNTTRLFAYIHLLDAHNPFFRRPDFDFGSSYVDLYDGGVAYVDDRLRHIVDTLGARGYAADTCLLVTADHGEALGEHGGYKYHATTLFEEQVRVPLVLIGPGISPAVIRGPLDATTIAPTLLRALGLVPPSSMHGLDMFAALNPPTSPQYAWAFAPAYRLAMVTDGRFKLIADRANATLALFDLQHDAAELRPINRADPASLARLLARLPHH
jgi:hypothetical protein